MSTHQHRVEVARSFQGDGRKVYAWCDCGWTGKSMDRHDDAVEDGDEHVRIMAGES